MSAHRQAARSPHQGVRPAIARRHTLRSGAVQAAVPIAVAVITVAAIAVLLPVAAGIPIATALAVGGVYLVGHALRAARLALLSIDMLGVSGRTTALMHMLTAPVSLALPFKLGELFRLHELFRLSGSLVNAVVVLLIERMYDSLFLVPFLIVLTVEGFAAPMLVFLTLLAAIIPLTVIVVGPRLLTEIQRYVVISHNDPRTLEALRRIDAARALVVRAAFVARRRGAELCVISLLIWACELAVSLILVAAATAGPDGSGEAASALHLLQARLVLSWSTISAAPHLAAAMAVTTIAVLLPWPIVALLYMARRKHEPRRTSAVVSRNRQAGS